MDQRQKEISLRRKEKLREHVKTKTKEQKDMDKMVIYENDEFMVINKPNGLASQGGDGINEHVDKLVTRYLQKQNFTNKAYLLHRLDQYWSGLMVIGKNIHYARTFSGLMEQKDIQKSYLALCQGVPKFLFNEKSNFNITGDSKFLSGMIRSDADWTIYDHTMLNPSHSFLNEHLQYLLAECKKLSMFSDKNDYEIVDEIVSKK